MKTFGFEDPTGTTRRQLDRLLDHKTLSNGEIERLRLRYVETGDLTARNEIVRKFQRAVANVAAPFKRKNPRLEISDLINEGNIGLLNAIQAYDPAKAEGCSFYTYAIRGTWNYIVDYLRKNNDTVVVTHTGRDKGHTAYSVSIDESPTSQDDDNNPGEDRLAQFGVYVSDDVGDLPSLDETVAAYGASLSEREREVLRMRAGDATFATIGREFGISVARSEQILQTAVRKVRDAVVATGVL